jgi:hypothetical protein
MPSGRTEWGRVIVPIKVYFNQYRRRPGRVIGERIIELVRTADSFCGRLLQKRADSPPLRIDRVVSMH